MNQLMTPQQVGTEYGVTVQELAEWRRKKIGPAYYVLGTRIIRYMPENVDQWFRDPVNSRWHDFPAQAFTEECESMEGAECRDYRRSSGESGPGASSGDLCG